MMSRLRTGIEKKIGTYNFWFYLGFTFNIFIFLSIIDEYE